MNLISKSGLTLLLTCLTIILIPFFHDESCNSRPIKSGLIAWKAEPPANEKNQKAPSYLVGTVHSITSPEYDFNPRIDEFMASCEIFVMESGNTLLLSYDKTDIFLPGDVKLKDIMSRNSWQKLSAMCIESNIGGDCERYMPWYLAVLLTRPEIRKSDSTIMDVYLQRKAAARSMKIHYLETMITYSLNKCPIEEQISDLESLIDNSREIEFKSDEIINIYNSGNHKKLYEKMMNEDGKDIRHKTISAHMNRLLIDERNASWLPEMEKDIAAGGAFIAVGTAHLIGNNGIIETLNKKGYILSDVSSPSGE